MSLPATARLSTTTVAVNFDGWFLSYVLLLVVVTLPSNTQFTKFLKPSPKYSCLTKSRLSSSPIWWRKRTGTPRTSWSLKILNRSEMWFVLQVTNLSTGISSFTSWWPLIPSSSSSITKLILKNCKMKLQEYAQISSLFLKIGLKNTPISPKGSVSRPWTKFTKNLVSRSDTKTLTSACLSTQFFKFHQPTTPKRTPKIKKTSKKSPEKSSQERPYLVSSLWSLWRLKTTLLSNIILYFLHQDCMKWRELDSMLAKAQIFKFLEVCKKVESMALSSETVFSTAVDF